MRSVGAQVLPWLGREQWSGREEEAQGGAAAGRQCTYESRAQSANGAGSNLMQQGAESNGGTEGTGGGVVGRRASPERAMDLLFFI